jgi:hypothetical protein
MQFRYFPTFTTKGRKFFCYYAIKKIATVQPVPLAKPLGNLVVVHAEVDQSRRSKDQELYFYCGND